MRRGDHAVPRVPEFQSTPPVAGRRCRSTPPSSRWRTSFNPRLPLLGGDALVYPGETTPNGPFQSTPPVAGRRCSAIQSPAAHQKTVSIHASRCWEAMRAVAAGCCSRLLFQSTPPVAGRRCQSRRHRARRPARFNPRLPLLGGDALDFLEAALLQVVSIHASRCWEAMHKSPRTVLTVTPVSIHASRCWEAMRDSMITCQQRRGVSIHASRCWEAMPEHHPSPPPDHRCFNPRLPLLGGDAPACRRGGRDVHVSIHASRCWEAMLS